MVAGFGTILIPSAEGDMMQYIDQLERLRDLEPHLIFPSHGPVIPLPQKKLNQYIRHRSIRHDKVLQALEQYSSLDDIAKSAYEDTPEANPFLAKDQTLSHLLSHQRAGTVLRVEGRWHITP
jgi:glyoxylase-like metal-dependent hydrolase (beta-lactamase superfamily II)